ncbi:MAG TPA: ERF family protein [Chryseosolibacter sp.]|nr:ERF family protein [Chryseosolibacter sp.]
MNALQTIQQKLKAPKSQYNSFGKYHFRNSEDIQEAVKPLLLETNSTLIIPDRLVEIGGHLFIEAAATLTEYDKDGNPKNVWITTAYAKHAVELKGMQDSQVTGATSSYARKYALNGLFLIDDTRDADATNDHSKSKTEVPTPTETSKPPKAAKPPATKDLPWLNEGTPDYTTATEKIKGGMTIEQLEKYFRISKVTKEKLKAL